jgi:hypothetical protein
VARLARDDKPLSIADQLRADYKPPTAEEEHKRLLKLIRERDVEDWHPFWGNRPLSERRELILEAGRPELIDEATCERFGITEETWPSDVYRSFGKRPAG